MVATFLVWQRWDGARTDESAERLATAFSATGKALRASPGGPAPVNPAGADAVAVAAEPAADVAAVDRLWTAGSLRGTELDGDWGRWSSTGLLQPSFGLRQRFDQLLSAQGEVDLGALRRWVEAQVTTAHGRAGALQVLDLWDRYLKVKSARYAVEANPYDATTWQPALAEHGRVRREALGSAWAEAFFGDEERRLAADAASRQASPATRREPLAADALLAPAPAPDGDARLQAARAAQFGADAADRLQANDAEWQAWQQRIDAARATSAAIASDPALSPVQRQAAEARLLAEQFTPEEQARARYLIAPTR